MANSSSEALTVTGSECLQANNEADAVPPNVAELVVIRHGETAWNASGIIQGHLDPELNELGRKQAISIAEKLSRESKISAIYSSDLKRAVETAKAISEKCGSIEVILDPGIKERRLGQLQGLVLRDAPKTAPKAYEAFVSSKTDCPIPRIVVVSHGGVLREFFNRAAPRGSKRGRILNVFHNVIYISDKKEWSIKSWGDVSHLHNVGYLANAFGGDKMSG